MVLNASEDVQMYSGGTIVFQDFQVGKISFSLEVLFMCVFIIIF